MLHKNKIYQFNKSGLDKAIKDKNKEKTEMKSYIIVSGIIGTLFIGGIVAEGFTIKYFAGTITGKTVRWFIN